MTQSKIIYKLSLSAQQMSPSVLCKDGKQKNSTEKNLYDVKKTPNNKPPQIQIIKLKQPKSMAPTVNIPVYTKNTPVENY